MNENVYYCIYKFRVSNRKEWKDAVCKQSLLYLSNTVLMETTQKGFHIVVKVDCDLSKHKEILDN